MGDKLRFLLLAALAAFAAPVAVATEVPLPEVVARVLLNLDLLFWLLLVVVVVVVVVPQVMVVV